MVITHVALLKSLISSPVVLNTRLQHQLRVYL